MIPTLNASLVLPPYIGAEASSRAHMSPYDTDLIELIRRFGISPNRIAILRGLLSYRSDLRAIGICDGWQWLNGSFTEGIEMATGRSPADIDLVTFAHLPGNSQTKRQLALDNLDLFDARRTWLRYRCDGYVVDLTNHAERLVDDTRYWFGLFSHQRATLLWKGMLKVSMADHDDRAALMLLNDLERQLGGGPHA